MRIWNGPIFPGAMVHFRLFQVSTTSHLDQSLEMAREKHRHSSKLRRGRPKRQPYDRVLIVCEDSKAAPRYFRELKTRYRLSTANIVIEGVGADPRRLVETAKRSRDEQRRRRNPYDSVYCVFDQDQHTHFNSASHDARAARRYLARSWPCFEFWYVLHFTYRRSPYTPSGNRTASQNCVRDIRQRLPHYTKGMAGVFDLLESRLEGAKSNAKRARMDAETTGRDDPSTEVHSLVSYLQDLNHA